MHSYRNAYVSLLIEPLLSKEQELALAHAATKGDMEARHKLVEANLRLVLNTLKRYSCCALSREDLFQEGILGLIVASERFDPERGLRFSTYATYWIRQSISKAVDGKSRSIRLPSHILRLISEIDRFRVNFVSERGQEPTEEQIGEAVGLSVSRVRALRSYSRKVRSLDTLQQETLKASLVNSLVDPEPSPEQWYAMQESRRDLHRLLSTLSPRERKVIELRFPTDGSRFGLTQAETAKWLGMPKSEVRRIELKSIEKLRQLVESQEQGRVQPLS